MVGNTQLVEVLRHGTRSSGFNSRWSAWKIFKWPILSVGFTEPPTEYQISNVTLRMKGLHSIPPGSSWLLSFSFNLVYKIRFVILKTDFYQN